MVRTPALHLWFQTNLANDLLELTKEPIQRLSSCTMLSPPHWRSPHEVHTVNGSSSGAAAGEAAALSAGEAAAEAAEAAGGLEVFCPWISVGKRWEEVCNEMELLAKQRSKSQHSRLLKGQWGPVWSVDRDILWWSWDSWDAHPIRLQRPITKMFRPGLGIKSMVYSGDPIGGSHFRLILATHAARCTVRPWQFTELMPMPQVNP